MDIFKWQRRARKLEKRKMKIPRSNGGLKGFDTKNDAQLRKIRKQVRLFKEGTSFLEEI